GHEAGSSGQKEPEPDLPRHRRTGAWGRDFHHVRRLARSIRLLVQVLLQGHLPRQLVLPDRPQPPATWDQL
ncbi:Epoxyqueuosine reductase, partial [Clarias magur]